MLGNKLTPKSEGFNTTKAYLSLMLHAHCGLIEISISVSI